MRTRSASLLVLALALPAVAGGQTPVRAPGGTLRGVVHDNLTGRPVGYALVVLVERDQRVFSSESGRFTLTGLSPGAARLRIQQIGYRARLIPLRVDVRPQDGGAV